MGQEGEKVTRQQRLVTQEGNGEEWDGGSRGGSHCVHKLVEKSGLREGQACEETDGQLNLCQREMVTADLKKGEGCRQNSSGRGRMHCWEVTRNSPKPGGERSQVLQRTPQRVGRPGSQHARETDTTWSLGEHVLPEARPWSARPQSLSLQRPTHCLVPTIAREVIPGWGAASPGPRPGRENQENPDKRLMERGVISPVPTTCLCSGLHASSTPVSDAVCLQGPGRALELPGSECDTRLTTFLPGRLPWYLQ